METMTFSMCFWYLVLCRALAEYLSVLLFTMKACRATDQGAEKQAGNGLVSDKGRRKAAAEGQ